MIAGIQAKERPALQWLSAGIVEYPNRCKRLSSFESSVTPFEVDQKKHSHVGARAPDRGETCPVRHL